MGTVFRGEDGETREPVVIKVVRVGLTPERAAVVGAALVSLRDRLPSHPALAVCFDAGVVDVEPYLVSAFVDGDSLDLALREYGPALLVDALPRLRLIADGLDAAAAAGIAHGSLHPRDILVAVEHTVLQGLGLAGVLERVGVRPTVRRPYCAPEVALGLGVSPAGDQYSLAAVAHEWLTGRRLGAGQEQAVRIPGLAGEAAETMREVFARALAESPDARFPTATAFVEAMAELAPYAAGRPKSSRRAPAAAPPRLSFDEPDEPADPIPAIVAAATAAAIPGPPEADDAANELDEPDDLVAEPAGAAMTLGDLPIVRDLPDRSTWDENPLSEFTVAPVSDDEPLDASTAFAGDGELRDDDPDVPDDPDEPVDRDDDASETEDEDDEVVPDDDLEVPIAPVVVSPAAPSTPEPDFVEASLPLQAEGPTSWDDEAPAPASDEPSGMAASDGDRAWTTWVVGIVAFTLLAVGGGWALVRWGTPSAPRESATAAVEPASSEVTPPAAAVAPRATTPPEPIAEPSTPRQTATAPPAPPATTPRATPETPASVRQASPTPAPAPAKPPTPAPAPRQERGRAATAPPTRPARQTTPARQATPARQTPTPPVPAAADAAATSARLLVRSTPGGAEVFVNGERRGVTPLALRDLPLGSYAVRITRAGYAPVDERVVLERGRPSRSIEVTLARAGAASPPAPASPPAVRAGSGSATTGALVVETRPPGARVVIDGNDVGVTPVTLPSLPTGAHRIRIERPGYAPITTTTTIEAGARARVAVTLTPERP